MTFDELAVAAANRKEPKDMDMAERAAYWPMAALYEKARAGEIGPADGRKEKNRLERLFDRDKARLADADKATEYNGAFWKRIEQTATIYAKSENRTPEGDAFFEAVYGLRPGKRKTEV